MEQNGCSRDNWWKQRRNVQMLMRKSSVLPSFKLFLSSVVASADIFSCPEGGFLSHDALPSDLVRRSIILLKFEFYLCILSPSVSYLLQWSRKCLTAISSCSHAHSALFYCQFYRHHRLFMPLVCLLTLNLFLFFKGFYCGNKHFRFQDTFFLSLFSLLLPLQLGDFLLSVPLQTSEPECNNVKAHQLQAKHETSL